MARAGRHLVAKDGIWHYSRRVPARFADVDSRTFVRISLETRDLRQAERLKPQVERDVEAFWLALKKGGSADAHERYLGAIERVRLEGFEYRTSRELAAESTVADLVARIARLEEAGGFARTAPGKAETATAEALLGGVPRPELTLTKGLDEFFALTKDRVRKKSPDQLRRWKAPRQKAVNNLVALVGDKPVTEISRADALALRAWWVERVTEEDGYTPNSANKDIGHLAQLFDTLNELLELGMTVRPFSRLRLPDDRSGQRAAFSVEQLQKIALDPASLSGMNEDARGVVLAMVETGMRPVEICGLAPGDIVLEAEVPHVRVRPNTRALKTVYSEREIPLVGISLAAFAASPGGFPRYRDRSSQLSALVNKVMRGRGLLPTEEHSLYSIRHTFQDRLTAADMPDRMQADLMGHKFDRPLYGAGPTLAHKRDWLQRLAIT